MTPQVFCEPLSRSLVLGKFQPCFEIHADSLARSRLAGATISELGKSTRNATAVSLGRRMDEARRQRFLEYFKREWAPRGGRNAMMQAAKPALKKARVAQLFDATQPFGQLAAQRLALRLGLDKDFFEVVKDGYTRRAHELARLFDAAPDGGEKDRIFASTSLSLEKMAAPEETVAKPSLSQKPMPALADTQ